VALGALIGTFAGKKTVLASHDNPNNVIDRIMLGAHVASAQGGRMEVGLVLPTDELLRPHLPEKR
jgi:hypothetical protein